MPSQGQPPERAPFYFGYFSKVREREDVLLKTDRKEVLLCDRYGLTAAFEHHDDVLKRTLSLRAGQRDASGTIYLGDGCFRWATYKLR